MSIFTDCVKVRMILAVALASVLTGSAMPARAAVSRRAREAWLKTWQEDNPVWRGVHLAAQDDRDVAALGGSLPTLKAVGANAIILEVDYNFEFKSHPELRAAQAISRKAAEALAQGAHELGIRLIPEFNCLGHQSWGRTTAPLLTKYPQFDETPGQYPNNEGIYCRSWCPQNPEVNKVVFALLDDLADGFAADAIHVGMDEVFLIASEHCTRCRGGDPAKLFAKAVSDLHAHVVGKRKLEMMMWGDRLLDAKALGYSPWEAATNGTAAAIDAIPKDIVVCDWHYEKRAAYPSVPLLLGKGFRVWPTGWQPLEASKAFSDFARELKGPLPLGFLCTTWGKVEIPAAAEWPPVMQILHAWEK